MEPATYRYLRSSIAKKVPAARLNEPIETVDVKTLNIILNRLKYLEETVHAMRQKLVVQKITTKTKLLIRY